MGYFARGYFVASKFEDVNKKRTKELNKRLDQVRDFVKEQGIVSNNDIEKEFNVSDATATRYLDAFEAEGFIKAQGSGSGLRYIVIKK